MRNPLCRLLFLLLALAAAVAGCGYHSPYSSKPDTGSGTTVIYLNVWENRTNELGFEGAILHSIANWLQESKHVSLTTDRDKADLLLSGSIDFIDYPATAFSGSDRATTLKARVKTSYQLIRNKTGEKVRQTQNNIREATYNVGTDAVRTQGYKKTALEEIANAIGEQIYLEIFYTLTGDQT